MMRLSSIIPTVQDIENRTEVNYNLNNVLYDSIQLNNHTEEKWVIVWSLGSVNLPYSKISCTLTMVTILKYIGHYHQNTVWLWINALDWFCLYLICFSFRVYKNRSLYLFLCLYVFNSHPNKSGLCSFFLLTRVHTLLKQKKKRSNFYSLTLIFQQDANVPWNFKGYFRWILWL